LYRALHGSEKIDATPKSKIKGVDKAKFDLKTINVNLHLENSKKFLEKIENVGVLMADLVRKQTPYPN
jgi:hypothetical protein